MLSFDGVFCGVGRSEAAAAAAAAVGVVAAVSERVSMTLLAGEDMGLSKTSASAGPGAAAPAGTELNPFGRHDVSFAGTEEQGYGGGG